MKYTKIYCDGGERKWAFIVVQGTEILKRAEGDLGEGHTNDETEAEAVFQAIEYAWSVADNYVIYTDSKSVLQKSRGTWSDHTGNKRFQGIKNRLRDFERSNMPRSCVLKYKRRCSDEFSKYVDRVVSQ